MKGRQNILGQIRQKARCTIQSRCTIHFCSVDTFLRIIRYSEDDEKRDREMEREPFRAVEAVCAPGMGCGEENEKVGGDCDG
jgi:hypothetical protein